MCNGRPTYLQHIKHNMSIFDTLLSVIAPHECLGCGAEGALLCGTCRLLLPDIPPRCYRCRRISSGGLTCRACRKVSRLRYVRAATDYEGIAQQLVWRLKFGGAQAAKREIVHSLLPLVRQMDCRDACIVPVPTATSRVRQRGYDQAKLIARQLAQEAHLPYIDCVQRQGQTHQVGASRRQRQKQLAGAFYVRRPQCIRNGHLILVDDVLTTGATLEAAAAVLRRAGAGQIDALVFAQA